MIHTLNYPMIRFFTIRHTEERDIQARTWSVSFTMMLRLSPNYKHLMVSSFQHVSILLVNRLTLRLEKGVSIKQANTCFFEVMVVLNPESYINTPTSKLYERAEKQKTNAHKTSVYHYSERGTRIFCFRDIFGLWRKEC